LIHCGEKLNVSNRLIAEFNPRQVIVSDTSGELTAIALAHERLAPQPGKALSDHDLGEVVQGMRIDLGIWLRYVS
jgi:hypothetical protein